ncbi:MAG: AbrB family transcriptional regulator [Deltaproteobacteria bacterium RIFOXYD12_FULL_50_9]|nr:MAG: AbrB family transcriptional regulator [Deltaproteobacteria bacterium RIFOXYD12_FULL_50_9]
MDSLAKVSTKGQVVIPAELRKRHHLGPGASVQIFEYGNLICLAPIIADPVEAAWGALPETPSLADELLQERRKDFCDEKSPL